MLQPRGATHHESVSVRNKRGEHEKAQHGFLATTRVQGGGHYLRTTPPGSARWYTRVNPGGWGRGPRAPKTTTRDRQESAPRGATASSYPAPSSALPPLSPSPRWASDASLSRAIVTEDELAHSWWACPLVCRAHQRLPPLAAATLEAVAPAVEAAIGPVLLTPRQAWRLGARVDEIDEACPSAGPLTGSKPTPFSLEYLYEVAALAGRSDRAFRKACRKVETALAARKLPLAVRVVHGSGVSDEMLRGCASCRRRWMERRAADARDAAKREGRRYEGPPWAGVTKRGFLSAAAELRALPGARAMHAAMHSI